VIKVWQQLAYGYYRRILDLTGCHMLNGVLDGGNGYALYQEILIQVMKE
jgi:hypothetical protein